MRLPDADDDGFELRKDHEMLDNTSPGTDDAGSTFDHMASPIHLQVPRQQFPSNLNNFRQANAEAMATPSGSNLSGVRDGALVAGNLAASPSTAPSPLIRFQEMGWDLGKLARTRPSDLQINLLKEDGILDEVLQCGIDTMLAKLNKEDSATSTFTTSHGDAVAIDPNHARTALVNANAVRLLRTLHIPQSVPDLESIPPKASNAADDHHNAKRTRMSPKSFAQVQAPSLYHEHNLTSNLKYPNDLDFSDFSNEFPHRDLTTSQSFGAIDSSYFTAQSGLQYQPLSQSQPQPVAQSPSQMQTQTRPSSQPYPLSSQLQGPRRPSKGKSYVRS